MSQYLSHWKTYTLRSKNILKFILNINFEWKLFHTNPKEIDLLQINRKNMKYVTLSGSEGYKVPILGLGTWKSVESDVYNAVLTSLDVGYRHIDTAFNYNNEEQIGKALKEWIDSGKGKREDLFITTKLPVFGNRAKDAERFLKSSMTKLNVSYIDLYLIHMPFAFQLNDEAMTLMVDEDGAPQLDLNNDNIATWKVLEQQVKAGLVRSIGLSNFNAQQVQKIYQNSEIKPSVLQIEMHAHLQQNELLDTCKKLNIAVTAYAPLGSPATANYLSTKYKYELKTIVNLLTNPVVQEIAKKYNKTTGQILLRHLIEKNVIVIPKSSNPKRIEENFKIFDFDLGPKDIETLNALDKKEEGRMFNFLFFKGVEKHPEYPFKDTL